jgi:hypothetical protein
VASHAQGVLVGDTRCSSCTERKSRAQACSYVVRCCSCKLRYFSGQFSPHDVFQRRPALSPREYFGSTSSTIMSSFSKLLEPRRSPTVQLPPPSALFPELSQQYDSKPCLAPGRELQVIEDRYIDDVKLLEYCKQRFGIGNYRLRVARISVRHRSLANC